MGYLEKITSDDGTHFVNQALKEISVRVGFRLQTHCAWRGCRNSERLLENLQHTSLSLYEELYGRAARMGAEPPKWTGVSTELCNSEIIVYCQNLPKTLADTPDSEGSPSQNGRGTPAPFQVR